MWPSGPPYYCHQVTALAADSCQVWHWLAATEQLARALSFAGVPDIRGLATVSKGASCGGCCMMHAYIMIVYMCMHMYMYAYVYMYMYMYMHMMCICMCIYILLYVHIHSMKMYRLMYMCIYIYACPCMCTRVYICVYVYVYNYIHTYSIYERAIQLYSTNHDFHGW